MKKKVLAMSLAMAMTAAALSACGEAAEPASTTATETTEEAKTEEPAATETTEAAADTTEAAADDTAAPAGDEGTVLNIYGWNDEFASRLTNHYPGYEAADPSNATAGGKIGDVTVNFVITPNENNAYQNALDEALLGQADAAADSKVDLFLIEADYALKYVDADASMPLSELGISASDLSDQYKYTQDIVTDSNGNLKGSSWQACSAGLIYNREAAKEILGSDDPADVQAAVSDWSKFAETAQKAKDAGYKMCSVNDTYRVYSNNVSGKWVQDGKIIVDANIKNWVDDSKALVDAGALTTDDLWGDDWAKAKYPDGKTFCYFGPAWFFNFCLAADDAASIAANGGWGYCVGPQSFFWGGTWICAAAGTDNPSLVKDIILTMTTDQAVLKEIAQQDADCVNSKTVLTALASDDSGKLDLLGGQNPYQQLADGADKIDLSNLSAYDQACNEEFQNKMKDFFLGNADYDAALDAFYTAVEEKHPSLTH